MFILQRIAFALAPKPYLMRLLFTYIKNGDFDTISVTERSLACAGLQPAHALSRVSATHAKRSYAAPISKAEIHISSGVRVGMTERSGIV